MTLPTTTARREGEAGFTLIELLAAIAILGIISFVLTEAILLSLKTVEDATARVGNSATTQTVESYFTGDAQSALVVSSGGAACGVSDPAVVNLAWTDQATPKVASYVLVPASGNEHDLVRRFCVGNAPPDERILGHYVHKPTDPFPLSASWTDSTVTLTVQSNSTTPGGDFVVTRRTAS